MAALHPIADLDGGHPQPRLAGAARSARPVPAPATLRRVEPLAAVFLGLHGVMVLANLAVEAELELGRRERLGRALLDALTDPTAVLDPQGRIVAVNQAWTRFAAGGLAGLAVQMGQSYPVACAAAADAGYDAQAPAANRARAVLAGEMALFRCRYQDPNGAGPFEVTVTSLADGAGAVVTHRPPPA